MFTVGELEKGEKWQGFCILPSASVFKKDFIINIAQRQFLICWLPTQLQLEELYERVKHLPLLQLFLPIVLWLGYETACLKQLL